MIPLANHLWQSTVFAATTGLLCFALRKHQASIRYWLWLAASVKFLVPLSLLIDLGSRIKALSVPSVAPTPLSSMVRDFSQPFTLPVPAPLLERVPNAPSPIPAVLFAIWICGSAASAFWWLCSWLRMRAAVRTASPLETDLPPGIEPVRVMKSSVLVEPCVFGIFDPVLLVPDGITEHLTHEQLETIFLHEICHVRRRDNLAAAVHMTMETLFWFYPLAYWIGRRLLNERESACDEEVLRIIPKPEAYARGILAVCRLGVRVAPVCAAGVAGSGLRKRIDSIMGRRVDIRLGLGRKLLVAAALAVAMVGPFLAGVLFVRAGSAQTQGAVAGVSPFGVASVRRNRSGERNSGFRRFVGGVLNARNITLKMLITFAYDLPEDRVLQGPAWLDSERYDVLAKPDQGGGQAVDQSMGAMRLRTQALLADRFKVILHKETRRLPIFRLLVDKDGPSHLQPAKGTAPDLFTNGHHVTCQAASMAFFARNFLTGQLGGPVLDETGIVGNFDFSLDWGPDDISPRRPPDGGELPAAPDPTGPSLFTALRQQLGLKVEAGKGPVEVLVIDHAEKASKN
ncbi:MAG: TIGR03435 family protein [Acidobacteria bacterium]|nr:TIGR03435 family protein [Acidobacteriota bacterium]